MKKQISIWLAVVLGMALLLSLALPVRAQVNRIQFTAYEYDCFTGLEDDWTAGQVYHMRGVRHTNINVASVPELNGINTTVADAEFNLNTGSIVIRGTNSLQPEGINGTWEGTWQYINNHGVIKGQAVARGTGELSGKSLFTDIYDAPYDPETEGMCAGIGLPEGNVISVGYILETGSP